MPDNKMLDGIKKIKGENVKKARDIVLKSIGESVEHDHKLSHAQKPRAEAGGFNFEKDKKYNISKSKKVDGVFSGKISNGEKYIHHDEVDKKFQREEQKNILAQQEKRILAVKKEKAAYEKNKHEKEKRAILNARVISEKYKNKKTQKHGSTKTRKHRNTKTRKHESAKTKILNKISGKKIANFFPAKAFLKIFAYVLLVLATASILFYILFFIALAIFDYDSSTVRKVSKYLPAPVLITKIGAVGYYNYKDAMDNFYYYYQGASKEKIKQELIKEIIINRLAAKYGIQITFDEQEQEFSRTISGKSEDEIRKTMGAYYELGAERYMERIIKPELIRKKASQEILRDQEINHSALLKISKIKQAAEAGRDFYTISEEMGDGFGFGKYYDYDEAISMFGDSVKNINVGQISNVIIIDNKYYIIYCFARRENSIGLRHVFVNVKSLDDYASEMVSGLKVWSFVD